MVVLRKSSEGPAPWAFHQQQQAALFPSAAQHLLPHSQFGIGQPQTIPPVRRASLQYPVKPEEHRWPTPLESAAEEQCQQLHPSDIGIGCWPKSDNFRERAQPAACRQQWRSQEGFHRRSQPSLAEQRQSRGEEDLTPTAGTTMTAAAMEKFTISHHQSGQNGRALPQQQAMPSNGKTNIGCGGQQQRPTLASNGGRARNGSKGTPPANRQRRQLPPLLGQYSFSNSSPVGSPRANRKFASCHPPTDESPMRKGSVGPACSATTGIGRDEPFPRDYEPWTWESPADPHYGGPQLPDHLLAGFSAFGAPNRSSTNPSGFCRSGVERRILRRCPQSDLASRLINQRHHHEGSSRGSSFSGSNESTPTRTTLNHDNEPEIVDPVYLALKQATTKYGNVCVAAPAAGTGSRTGSRRNSQCALVHHSLLFDSATPSPRNLSQTSLQDSGYSGGEMCGSRSQLVGSTPHLHGNGAPLPSGLALLQQHHSSSSTNGPVATAPNGGPAGAAALHPQIHLVNSNGPAAFGGNGGGTAAAVPSAEPIVAAGRRPKLTEKMKSLSLDCAEMPPPVQPGLGRSQCFKSKPIRSARGFATSGESFDGADHQQLERSISPPTRAQPPPGSRRLPPAPPQQQQQPRQQTQAVPPTAATLVPPLPQRPASAMTHGTHIVIHEYVTGDCSLYLGERMVVVDNGDPDWKHGFKLNDRLEQLYTFPSTCVAAFQPDEQPMRLVQNCNLVEKKLRLYRDQVVFVQPESLREDGRVLIRNEHGTYAYCPLQFLLLM